MAKTPTDKIAIQEAVVSCLSLNSGGVKMVQLTTELSSIFYADGHTSLAKIVGSDDFDLILDAMEVVSVFEYDWDMGGGNIRSKQFVATKY